MNMPTVVWHVVTKFELTKKGPTFLSFECPQGHVQEVKGNNQYDPRYVEVKLLHVAL